MVRSTTHRILPIPMMPLVPRLEMIGVIRLCRNASWALPAVVAFGGEDCIGPFAGVCHLASPGDGMEATAPRNPTNDHPRSTDQPPSHQPKPASPTTNGTSTET